MEDLGGSSEDSRLSSGACSRRLLACAGPRGGGEEFHRAIDTGGDRGPTDRKARRSASSAKLQSWGDAAGTSSSGQRGDRSLSRIFGLGAHCDSQAAL